MSCRAHYSICMLMCSRQPLPNSPTWYCRLESFLPNTSECRCFHCWRKPGLTVEPANYRPILNLPTVSNVPERLVLAHLWPHLLSSTNFSQFQSAYRKGHSTETALLKSSTKPSRQQASYCNDRPQPVGGLRRRWPPAPPRLEFRDTTRLAAVLSCRLDPIREDGPASITGYRIPRGCPRRVCAQASVVCGLLQPDHRHHHSPRRTVSSIRRRRHAAQSCHARRQYTSRAVRSRWVYHWRQTVVPAEQPTAQLAQVYHWNDQSTACGDVIRVISVRGRSRSASSRRD